MVRWLGASAQEGLLAFVLFAVGAYMAGSAMFVAPILGPEQVPGGITAEQVNAAACEQDDPALPFDNEDTGDAGFVGTSSEAARAGAQPPGSSNPWSDAMRHAASALQGDLTRHLAHGKHAAELARRDVGAIKATLADSQLSHMDDPRLRTLYGTELLRWTRTSCIDIAELEEDCEQAYDRHRFALDRFLDELRPEVTGETACSPDLLAPGPHASFTTCVRTSSDTACAPTRQTYRRLLDCLPLAEQAVSNACRGLRGRAASPPPPPPPPGSILDMGNAMLEDADCGASDEATCQTAVAHTIGYVNTLPKLLLNLDSIPLAHLVGACGFGILGATSGRTVRRRLRADAETGGPFSSFLGGISAAAVIFLAVKGGLTTFAQGGADPNPWLLFFACLVAAVFYQEVWERASGWLFRAADGDGADGGAAGGPAAGHPPAPQ